MKEFKKNLYNQNNMHEKDMVKVDGFDNISKALKAIAADHENVL